MKRRRQRRMISHLAGLEDDVFVDRVEILAAKIRKAEKEIDDICRRYSYQKSRLQLLVRIRGECGDFTAMVVIARIRRNQWDQLSQEDKNFVEDERQKILQNLPSGMDCPAGF